MSDKYLTKKEYNETTPKWFSEFLTLYKADRKQNDKHWEENNKRWEENNKRWDKQEIFNRTHKHDK